MSPSPFQLLPWQDEIWQRLQPALTGARMPHALMLTGAPGIGKLHLAKVLGAALLCRAPQTDGLPCGVCTSCSQMAGGAHPDFRELTPEPEKKTISVEQVRAFSRTRYLRPQIGQARVGLIHPVERLYPSAANALLKTLEEPPAGSHILLVTAQPSAVIATIRSRCQFLRVPLPTPAAMAGWLETQPESVSHAVSIARGAPLRALELVNADMLRLQGQWLEDLCAFAGARLGPSGLAQRWHEHPLPELLDWLYLCVADILKIAFNVPESFFANRAQQQSLRTLASRMDAGKLRKSLPRLIKARRMLDSNADKLLILEQLMITLWGCRTTELKRVS